MKNFPHSDASLTVSVIGLGYIGLPTAAVIASRKIHVLGVDLNEETVNYINQGKVTFLEPELDILVHATVSEGYLQAKTQPESADVFIIAVPTPFKAHHEPDLSYVEAAVRSIASVLKKGNLVILESTSPVGTTELVAQWLTEERPDLSCPSIHGHYSDINIAYCPERVMPGHVLRELVENDRVIGGLTASCSKKALSFYKIFVQGHCIETDTRTAEMCKLTENSFRDVNIAFANELSMICDKLNINVWELIQLANRHPRVNILQPGPGVGGHCIAVDPWFIVHKTPEEAKLISMARNVNDSKPHWVVMKAHQAVDAFLKSHIDKARKDVTIACLGLTFKADIEDIRESPAVEIVKKLRLEHDGPIMVVEPNISQLPCELSRIACQLHSVDEACKEADIILLLVDHQQFRLLTLFQFKDKVFLDIRGVYKEDLGIKALQPNYVEQ